LVLQEHGVLCAKAQTREQAPLLWAGSARSWAAWADFSPELIVSLYSFTRQLGNDAKNSRKFQKIMGQILLDV
jgi:hypothetical protein